MQYVTPSQFKRMATGVDYSSLADSDLSVISSLATAAVNRHCAVAKLPQAHDFRGGSITNEQIDYPIGNTFWPGSDKVWVMHRPVKAVSRFFLRITPDQGVNFDPADLYIHLTDGSIEVISLARRLSVFSAGFVPVLGLRQPVAELDYTYGWSFPVTGETFYADSTLKVFHGENGWWDNTQTVNVYVNGTIQATNAYTVNYNEGTVTFTAPVTNGTGVTVDYTYKLPNEIFEATSLVMANAINSNAAQAANLRGLQGLRVEETEMRWGNPRSGTSGNPVFEEFIDARVQSLLHAYRQFSWA